MTSWRFGTVYLLFCWIIILDPSCAVWARKNKGNRNRGEIPREIPLDDEHEASESSLGDFLPTPVAKDPDMSGPTCGARNRCGSQALSMEFHDRNCFCDDLCYTYGDCCRDYRSLTADKRVRVAKNTMSCQRVREIDRDVEVYLINSCPKDYVGEDIRQRCEDYTFDDPFLDLPVTGKESQVLYRNVYCAVCAGDPDVTFWHLKLGCSEGPFHSIDNRTADPQEVMVEIMKPENHDRFYCGKEYFHPNVTARKCKSSIARCDRGYHDRKIAKKCRGYTAYVYVGLQVFKNKHCAMCNYVNETYLTCIDNRTPIRRLPVVPSDPEEGEEAVVAPPFVITLDMDNKKGSIRQHRVGIMNDFETNEMEVEMPACSEGHIYDPFANECRLVYCQPGEVLSQGQCIDKPVEVTQATTKKVRRTTTMNPGIYPDDMGTITSGRGNDPGVEIPGGTMDEYTYGEDKDYDSNGFDVRYEDNGNDDYTFSEPNCPLLKVNKNDFVIYSNGSVYIHSMKKLYNSYSYYMNKQSLFVCSPETGHNATVGMTTNTNKVVMFNYTWIQNLISWIALLFSLFALSMLFLVYMMLSPLRDVHGRCVISLIVVLFLAQVMLLVVLPRTEIHYVCLGLAAGMHYMWLATFFWVNVIAMDILRAFSSNNPDGKPSRFVAYSLYAWLMPAVIVGGSVAMEFLQYPELDNWRPHYGDGICWMTNKNALLFLFALPIALLLAINIILSAFTIRGIYVASQEAKLAQQQRDYDKDKTRFIIILKLSLIMGFTWVFAFLATLTEFNVLWYVFLSFNALQGVFICLACVCNKRVLGMLNSRGRVHRTSADTDRSYANFNNYNYRNNFSRPAYIFAEDGKEFYSRETSI